MRFVWEDENGNDLHISDEYRLCSGKFCGLQRDGRRPDDYMLSYDEREELAGLRGEVKQRQACCGLVLAKAALAVPR